MLYVEGWVPAVHPFVMRAWQSPWVPLVGPSACNRVPIDVGVLRPATGPAPGLPVSEVLCIFQVPKYRGTYFVHNHFAFNHGSPYHVELEAVPATVLDEFRVRVGFSSVVVCLFVLLFVGIGFRPAIFRV